MLMHPAHMYMQLNSAHVHTTIRLFETMQCPPNTKGEEGRSSTGHLLLISWQPLHQEHNSGYITLIAIIDRPWQNPRATMSDNMHDEQCTP